jgi:glycosyltransferase involved in cell wall biosynthesis
VSDKKIKIFTISDMPFSPSGVGLQTKYMIEAMLETGKFSFISFGGAVKHEDYRPIRTDKWKDDWTIIPVDAYGSQEMIRSVLQTEKPDIVWFMTDPRFYGWLWDIEHEVRACAPMVYYHVWDNFPPPTYNKNAYDSNDLIVTISKKTDEVVAAVSPDVDRVYLPHAVDTEIFKKLPDKEIKEFKDTSFAAQNLGDKTVFFWNNRNARRKQSGSLIFWFKDFLDEVGHDQAVLVMHTDPKDQHGQDLIAIVEHLGLTDSQVIFSRQKVPLETMSKIYNAADCTINVSDAEGFGLATFESLACETPIIVNMTGGLQEQVTDGENWFGVGIEPASRAIIGSQQIPWIYEDRLAGKDVIAALKKIHKMSKKQRAKLGKMGRAHVMKNYNFENFASKWEEILLNTYEKHGSWEDRKNHKSWEIKEVV